MDPLTKRSRAASRAARATLSLRPAAGAAVDDAIGAGGGPGSALSATCGGAVKPATWRADDSASMTGDAPVTVTVSASEPGVTPEGVLTLPAGTVLDNAGLNAPDIAGAAGSAAMA